MISYGFSNATETKPPLIPATMVEVSTIEETVKLMIFPYIVKM